MTNKTLFNNNWLFIKKEIGTTLNEIKSTNDWNDVEIPHDWLIFDTHNLYKTNEGWYKKSFNLSSQELNERKISLFFDGVYMNSTVFVNDIEIGTWTYGYSSFEFDITSAVHEGENTVIVRVKHEAPNSRWYSGAGIYRNVYIVSKPLLNITTNGVYISTSKGKDSWTVNVETEIENISKISGNALIKHLLKDSQKKEIEISEKEMEVPLNEIKRNTQEFKVISPEIWDLDNCNLYTLTTQIIIDGNIVDETTNTIGFRTIEFSPENGFLLNGVQTKLKGVCMHHDLGALGSAINYTALKRQMVIMKEMGCNSIRTSHNMPAPELYQICNEIGLLVNAESYDMWEEPKTQFDNARFFNDTAHRDVESWVKNGRNNPCVILWSIGNEIHDTHAGPRGLEIAKMLKSYVLEFDPNQNAVVTIGSNYMQWENARNVADELKLAGYNYAEHFYDDDHKSHPDWFIYGSETASAVRSRGIYHFPVSASILTCDDLQCSSLGNSVVGWGSSAEHSWAMDRDRAFCGGQYIWTGFDYIGEPTPYSTKNSYFGIVDTAGIPKDIYYFYQAEWTDYKKSPMVHLLPYWDFNEGEEIDVIAYSNAPTVELFFNGASLGKQDIDHKNGKVIHAQWSVKYTKGELVAKAYDENGNVIATDSVSSFSDSKSIVLKADKNDILADGNDLVFVEISTVDDNGVFVANAKNRVEVEVTGAGRLVGLDNGDSTDYDSYKGTSRRLFSGKLMAIIRATEKSGEITVEVTSNELNSAEIKLNAIPCDNTAKSTFTENVKSVSNNEIPVRKIELSTDIRTLDENNKTSEVKYKLLPQNATYSDVYFKTVSENGVETNIATVNVVDNKAIVTAKGDGSFRLRAYCNNEGNVPQIISDIYYTVTGLGDAVRNPYKFTSACLYNGSNVPLNSLKDGALGGFKETIYASYNGYDFGKYGADKIVIHIGNCNGCDIPVEVWEGIPNESGSKLVTTAMFPDNHGWDGFEPYEFILPERITGQKTISILIKDRVIFGGFEFTPINKAFEKIMITDYDNLYGDEFKVTEHAIENIGNNVLIDFNDFDFTDKGATKITICGKTQNEKNTVQLRYTKDGVQKTEVLEFMKCDAYTERSFDIAKLIGINNISFVFLPGSKFDFEWFRFE